MALDENIVSAINNFLFSVTVPIFSDSQNIVDPKATGTFFEIRGRIFLITANHLFDEIDADTLAVPKGYSGKNQLQIIGKSEVSRPRGSHAASIDIAIIEILNPETIAIVKKGWQLLGLENVSQLSPDGDFLLSGFPSNTIKKVGNDFVGIPFSIISERIENIPNSAEQPVDPSIDLFFEYGPTAFNLRGEEVPNPRLQGASGASVWQIQKLSHGTTWTPQRALKLIGVQSSARHGEFFRVKNWHYVLLMLQKIDPALVQQRKEPGPAFAGVTGRVGLPLLPP